MDTHLQIVKELDNLKFLKRNDSIIYHHHYYYDNITYILLDFVTEEYTIFKFLKFKRHKIKETRYRFVVKNKWYLNTKNPTEWIVVEKVTEDSELVIERKISLEDIFERISPQTKEEIIFNINLLRG